MTEHDYYTYYQHWGNCQACGRTYKTAHEKLIQHDYPENNYLGSRAWTFLTGICAGSEKPPYELSRDLIPRMIRKAETVRKRIQRQQEKLRQPATRPKGWKYEDRGEGRFEWIQVIVHMEQVRRRDEIAHVFTYSIPGEPEPTDNRITFFPDRPTTETQAATILNRYYADWLQKQVAELDEYIRWQQQRMKKWEPRELQAVTKYKKKREGTAA